jgi:hypothetical protein
LFWCLEWTATAQFRVGFFVAPVFMLSGICAVAFSFPSLLAPLEALFVVVVVV